MLEEREGWEGAVVTNQFRTLHPTSEEVIACNTRCLRIRRKVATGGQTAREKIRVDAALGHNNSSFGPFVKVGENLKQERHGPSLASLEVKWIFLRHIEGLVKRARRARMRQKSSGPASQNHGFFGEAGFSDAEYMPSQSSPMWCGKATRILTGQCRWVPRVTMETSDALPGRGHPPLAR
jgi:hypothetical protein